MLKTLRMFVNEDSNQIIVDLNKNNKLNGTNYDIWRYKGAFLLNEQELAKYLNHSKV